MANPEHLAILKKGVEVWNAWRQSEPVTRPILTGADLTGADLTGADLTGADLSGADLIGADLTYADLSGAKIFKADFSNADLIGADLSAANLSAANLFKADFSGADLSAANLTGTNLTGANLFKADFSGAELTGAVLTGATFLEATLGWTLLSDLDLSEVRGLETVNHLGPSSIGVDTLYRSKASIPTEFLSQAGIPQSLISYLPSLLGAADGTIQFYSCFISHSTADHKFCAELYQRMVDNGLRVWFAPEDLKGGEKLHEQLEQAIRHYDKLLLVLSDASMASEWVAREVRVALRTEQKEGRRILFPIGLAPYERIEVWEGIFDKAIPGKDLTDEVREYYIPDFTNWQDKGAFEAEFEKLLKALRESERGSPA